MRFTCNLSLVCYGNSLTGLKGGLAIERVWRLAAVPWPAAEEVHQQGDTGRAGHVREDPPETRRWHVAGPPVPRDGHVSGRIRSEGMVWDMWRDPFFFNWNFSWTWDCFAAGGRGLRTLVKVIVFKLIHPSE